MTITTVPTPDAAGTHPVMTRHAMGIATYEGLDAACAARIGEVFRAANIERCSYDVVSSAVPAWSR